jgi:predicted metal-dependent phosphoesterase TrpH
MQINVDLHVHTTYSKDSLITPKDLIYFAKKRGLNAVAVTDHNSLDGAYKIAKETDFLVIPGMEISSADGHIVALNVKELIPRGLSALETVERIHNAGGVAIACHPYASFKGALQEKVCSTFDAIEVINARAIPFKRSVKKAEQKAKSLSLPRVAGTDAHYGPQIGYGYTVIEAPELSIEAVLKAIVKGDCQPFGQAVPFTLNFLQEVFRIKRMIKNLIKSNSTEKS